MKKKIFISYISSDKKKKNSLKRKINKTKRLEAIVVEDYSKSNKNFIDKVKDDINRADYFIPIFTKNSYKKSQWVNQELGYAEAKLGPEKICVLVQNDIIKDLKGFYNDKMDLPYNFDTGEKEQKNFRKATRKLIGDILEKERQNKIKNYKDFKSTSKKSYDTSDKLINLPITDSMKLHFKIKKASLNQTFYCYYEIETISGETLWIGSTDNKANIGKSYKTRNELTKHLGKENSLNYEFVENVKKTFLDRWPDKGSPKILKTIRFRGDKSIHAPILYSYKIEQ